MKVKVYLFAILRDKANVGHVQLSLAEGSTVRTAVDALLLRFPAMLPFAATLRYAVNLDYTEPATPLHEGDELALIPPVSGG